MITAGIEPVIPTVLERQMSNPLDHENIAMKFAQSLPLVKIVPSSTWLTTEESQRDDETYEGCWKMLGKKVDVSPTKCQFSSLETLIPILAAIIFLKCSKFLTNQTGGEAVWCSGMTLDRAQLGSNTRTASSAVPRAAAAEDRPLPNALPATAATFSLTRVARVPRGVLTGCQGRKEA